MTGRRRAIVVAWSGGKDSALALHALQASDHWEPVALLTTITQGEERVSVHGVRRSLLHAQARAIGLPVFEAVLPAHPTNAEYEGALADALDAVQCMAPDVHAIAFGDLFLADVRAYREAQIARLGWEPVFPLWGAPTNALAHRFVADGWRATLVCVDTTQLDAAFAGRDFDAALLAELPGSVDPCGEGGEFHTFVWDGPSFREPVAVSRGAAERGDLRFAYHDLQPRARVEAVAR